MGAGRRGSRAAAAPGVPAAAARLRGEEGAGRGPGGRGRERGEVPPCSSSLLQPLSGSEKCSPPLAEEPPPPPPAGLLAPPLADRFFPSNSGPFSIMPGMVEEGERWRQGRGLTADGRGRERGGGGGGGVNMEPPSAPRSGRSAVAPQQPAPAPPLSPPPPPPPRATRPRAPPWAAPSSPPSGVPPGAPRPCASPTGPAFPSDGGSRPTGEAGIRASLLGRTEGGEPDAGLGPSGRSRPAERGPRQALHR